MIDRLNTPLKLRQQRLAHSDAEMTLGVYSHEAREDDLRIAAQLGGILDLSGPFQRNVEAAKLVGEAIEKAVNSVSLTAIQEKGLPTGESEALAA
jgi:hypothetical protein